MDRNQNLKKNKTILHQSDFNYYDEQWFEENEILHKYFRRNGFYNIENKYNNEMVYNLLGFQCKNFHVEVEAQLNQNSDNNAAYGIVFCADLRPNLFSGYVYMVSSVCSFSLLAVKNNSDSFILPWIFYPKYSMRDKFNSLFVEKNGNKITLGLNGEVLSSVKNDIFGSGLVGLMVKSFPGAKYVGARFCNFRLFDIVK